MLTDTHYPSCPVSCSWAHPSYSTVQWKPRSRAFWKHAPLRFFAFFAGFCLPRSFLFLHGSILNHIFPYPSGNLVSYLFIIFPYTNSSWTGLFLPIRSGTPSGWETAASGLHTKSPLGCNSSPSFQGHHGTMALGCCASSFSSETVEPALASHLTTRNPDWIASLWAGPFSGRIEAVFFLASSQLPLSYI